MKTFSYTRDDRIRKRSGYQHISRFGSKVQNQFFVGLYMHSPDETIRLGITVTKKVGNAVVRNTIKRYCREYFRLNKHHINGFCDINIIAKKKASELAAPQVYTALQQIFEKIKRGIDHQKNIAAQH